MREFALTTSAGNTMTVRIDDGLVAATQQFSHVRERYILQSSRTQSGRLANLPSLGEAEAALCDAHSTRAARPISRTISRLLGSLT